MLQVVLTVFAFAQAKTDAVDKVFAQFAKSDSPGCAIGVSEGDQVTYQHAYGMADLERNVPLTTDSVFDVGSIAKQFTAACVVLLAQLPLPEGIGSW